MIRKERPIEFIHAVHKFYESHDRSNPDKANAIIDQLSLDFVEAMLVHYFSLTVNISTLINEIIF